VDLKKDRVYIPRSVMTSNGYSEAELFAGVEDARFQAVMKDAVDRARTLFRTGLPLARTVDRRLSVDLELFSRGGMLVLDKIERQSYRVLHNRPAVGKLERIRLLVATLARAAFYKAA
jgi:phytoene/squalene synthetase